MKNVINNDSTPVFIISENRLFRNSLKDYLKKNYERNDGEFDFHECQSVKSCFRDLELFKDNNFVIVNEETKDMVSELINELSNHLLHNVVLIRTNDKSEIAKEMLYPDGEEYVLNSPNTFQKIIDIFNRHKKLDKQTHNYARRNYIVGGAAIVFLIIVYLVMLQMV